MKRAVRIGHVRWKSAGESGAERITILFAALEM